MRKLGRIRPEADSSLLTIAVNFLYPCLIADNILANPALRDVRTVIAAPLTGAALLTASLGICLLAARLLRLGAPQPAGTFAFSSAIQNWGYLPIPLVTALFGQSTAGVLFVHNIGLELVLWTLGIRVLSGHGTWRKAVNIPFLAILGTLVLNFVGAGEWLPRFVLETIHFLGQAALPLSLLLTGVNLADTITQGGLTREPRATVAACALRLIVLPLLILCAAKFLPVSLELKQTLVVQAAMPCALVPVLLARHYRGHTPTAVRVVVTTTLLGLVTIVLWLRIGAAWVLS